MKKVYLFLIILLLVGIAIAIEYSPQSVPFSYDPNQVTGTMLGGISIEVGDYVVVNLDCSDKEGHPFVIVAVNSPIGMFVINSGNSWRIEWTPVTGQEGLHYVLLEATDSPPSPYQSKTFQGTIVMNVVAENTAPIIQPLEDSLIATNVWPGAQQKRWQELRKQGTVILGPVVMDLPWQGP